MASGRLADYLGKGDAVDRPATPTLHPEAIGIYYAEDTGELSLWDGAQWVAVPAGGGSGTVESIVAGFGINVDDTDPANPVVSATCGGSDLGWFNVIDYGATLDGVRLTDVATTASDNTVTSASAAFGSGDVGKVIEITSGSNRLKTTIASINSGTSIEVTDAPSFTASDCDTYYGTDDTDAWQDSINAAAAAGGGVVYAPAGISIIDGALQDTGRSNSQLRVPEIATPDEKPMTLVLRGEYPPPPNLSVIGDSATPDQHSIIKSTLNTGAGGSLLGGWGPSGSFNDNTRVNLIIQGLTFRMPANPVLTAIDASHIATLGVDQVIIDTGNYHTQGLAEPSTSTSYGLRMPRNNNGAFCRLGTLTVVGFYNGIELAEHATGYHCQSVFGCKNAFVFANAANHALHFQRLMAHHCEKVITATGATYVRIEQLDVEHASTGWWITDYDIDDPNNYIRGTIGGWHVVLAGTGVDSTFNVNGAARLNITRLGWENRVEQVSVSAAITFAGRHANKHILHPSADTTPRTWTIPANSSVPYPVGTTLTFVNQNGAGELTIAITSDTLRLAGAGTTGSRTLAANGIATAVKVASTEWVINGTGLT